jgi:hypothetical protein
MREKWRGSAVGRARRGPCQAEARLQTALEKSSSQSVSTFSRTARSLATTAPTCSWIAASSARRWRLGAGAKKIFSGTRSLCARLRCRCARGVFAGACWRILGGGHTGSNRVNRGGSWNNNANNCRSANRNRNNPDNRNNNLGFRVALAQVKAGWPQGTEPAAVPSPQPVVAGQSARERGPVRHSRQAAKNRSNSTVKPGTTALVSVPPGPWTARSANCSPCGWRWTSICFSGASTSQHSFTPARA